MTKALSRPRMNLLLHFLGACDEDGLAIGQHEADEQEEKLHLKTVIRRVQRDVQDLGISAGTKSMTLAKSLLRIGVASNLLIRGAGAEANDTSDDALSTSPISRTYEDGVLICAFVGTSSTSACKSVYNSAAASLEAMRPNSAASSLVLPCFRAKDAALVTRWRSVSLPRRPAAALALVLGPALALALAPALALAGGALVLAAGRFKADFLQTGSPWLATNGKHVERPNCCIQKLEFGAHAKTCSVAVFKLYSPLQQNRNTRHSPTGLKQPKGDGRLRLTHSSHRPS